MDATVGWFEGRQESSWNQSPLRFTKNLVLPLKTAGDWQEFGEHNHIYAPSSTRPQVSVSDNYQRQHIGLDGPLV